ncbi:MAG: hypothetical protein ACM3SY_17395 [Candidatus Omnitrophota bacterium]
MDQKEIDSLFSQGSITEYNKKQEELMRSLSEKEGAGFKKGKVIGQLTRVNEESEAGTNMVMGFLENVLSVISKQQGFIRDILGEYKKNPNAIYIDEVLTYLNDNNAAIEELIFSAMDAFQFQDIGRQKLMKVMYTLARLNEYLNELLGGEDSKEKQFGHQIEKRTLEKDKDKDIVDNIVENFHENENEIDGEGDIPEISMTPDFLASEPQPDFNPLPSSPMDDIPESAPSSGIQNNSDIDAIIAEFNEKQKKTETQKQTVSNDDIDSLIAEFQKKNK